MTHADRPDTPSRSDYAVFSVITSRWIDNDVYGHINNAVYYTYFDTVANDYLMAEGGLDIEQSAIVAFIVASSCQYVTPLAHPARIEGGLRVNHLGLRSVEYGIGIFAEHASLAAAHGTFTHVFVDRQTGRSVPIPNGMRTALERLTRQDE